MNPRFYCSHLPRTCACFLASSWLKQILHACGVCRWPTRREQCWAKNALDERVDWILLAVSLSDSVPRPMGHHRTGTLKSLNRQRWTEEKTRHVQHAHAPCSVTSLDRRVNSGNCCQRLCPGVVSLCFTPKAWAGELPNKGRGC